ncbi:aminotransferase class I/II-fold pyridoxal phosphate-dependent enzyme [Actinomadura rifamycini]|uniref:aminotransferase class I/II-fold pyridoxal phosphate-dependent enzyme n=1 Tax=Actinomadura rifamycini TaxID=31962 RepID=UPI0004144043|nr:aminotransferase class I/II-fold pyridoxal phosphate-dependent enzyme [Actinomadura rifamycini]
MTSAHRRLGNRMRDFHGAGDAPRVPRSRVPDGDRTVVLTCSDYLALGEHPAITGAMIAGLRAADAGGTVARARRPPADHPQVALGEAFARHMGAEAGVLCPSGWAANAGLMQVVAGPDVPVYLDALAHLSLWEGARAAGAEIAYFRHNDLDHLRRRIDVGGSGVVVVDAVYGTSGARGPLDALVRLAEERDCLLVVDESHSLGVRGERGEGLVGELGLVGRVDFRTASLSKALHARAGLIVCDRPEFADRLAGAAFPAVCGSALPAHDVAGLRAALGIVREEGWRRERLHAVTRGLRDGLAGLGYRLVDADTQIVAVETGTEPDALLLRDALMERDVFSAALFPQAASPHRNLVRLSAHAGLTDEDVALALAVCGEVRERMPLPRS